LTSAGLSGSAGGRRGGRIARESADCARTGEGAAIVSANTPKLQAIEMAPVRCVMSGDLKAAGRGPAAAPLLRPNLCDSNAGFWISSGVTQTEGRRHEKNYKIAIALLPQRAGAAAVQGLHAQAKPPGYVVVEIDVSNQEGFVKEFAPKRRKRSPKPATKALARAARSSPSRVRAQVARRHQQLASLDAATAA